MKEVKLTVSFEDGEIKTEWFETNPIERLGIIELLKYEQGISVMKILTTQTPSPGNGGNEEI